MIHLLISGKGYFFRFTVHARTTGMDQMINTHDVPLLEYYQILQSYSEYTLVVFNAAANSCKNSQMTNLIDGIFLNTPFRAFALEISTR